MEEIIIPREIEKYLLNLLNIIPLKNNSSKIGAIIIEETSEPTKKIFVLNVVREYVNVSKYGKESVKYPLKYNIPYEKKMFRITMIIIDFKGKLLKRLLACILKQPLHFLNSNKINKIKQTAIQSIAIEISKM